MSNIIPSTDPIILDYFTYKRAMILLDTSLDQMDSMVSAVKETELDSSIIKAINYINLSKPVTHVSVVDAVSVAKADPVYDHLILIGACYYILKTKWTEWGHSGDQIQLSILSEPDRMDRFEQLMNSFKEEFELHSANYKKAGNIRVSRASYIATSKTVGYSKGTATTRRGFKSAYRGS
jgi:hypothetical protein